MKREDRDRRSPCAGVHGLFRLTQDAAGRPGDLSFQRRYERFLDRSAALILERAGSERVVCLFVCGSFAAGEGSVLFVEGRPVFLSDLDLVLVVAAPRAHKLLYPRRRALAAACEQLFPQAVFAGRVDLGVMLAEELPALQPSPGVYDMRREGRVLRGDPSVLKMLPDIAAAEIGADAARLLCENRIAALLAVEPFSRPRAERHPPEFLYALARVYTDIATAMMCARGEYRPGYARRWRFIHSDPAGRPLREMLGERIVRLIGEWTAFKIRPEIDFSTASARGGDELWLEAASDIMGIWRRMAVMAAGCAPEPARSAPLDVLLAPCWARLRIGVLRAWKSWILGLKPAARPGALMTALACARQGEPLSITRREAVRLVDLVLEGGARCRVRAPRGGFPHGGGDWSAAARSVSAHWKRLVYGGEG